MKRSSRVVFFAILSVAWAAVSVFAAPVGEFAAVRGNVDLTAPGAPARPVSKGDPVSVGDIVRTKSGSKAEIAFSDGSIVRLAPASRLEITEYIAGKEETKGILKLYRGKIQSQVKKLFGGLFGRFRKNRYEVHTPTAVIGVRGTDFFVFHQSDLSGSVFKDGQGYGYCLNKPDIVREIEAGQALVVFDADTPPEVRPATDVEMERHYRDVDPEIDDFDAGQLIENGAAAAQEVVGRDTGREKARRIEERLRDARISTVQAADAKETEKSFPEIVVPPVPPEPPDLPEPPSFLEIEGEIAAPSLSADFGGRIPGLVSISGAYDRKPDTVWTAEAFGSVDDTGEFYGLTGGLWLSWDAFMESIFIDKDGGAGFLSGKFFGTDSGEPADGEFFGGGFMSATRMVSDAGIEPEDLMENLAFAEGGELSLAGSGEFSAGGTISVSKGAGESVSLKGQDWGISRTEMEGVFDGETGDEFFLGLKDSDGLSTRFFGIDGSEWSENGIRGTATGSWTSIEDATTGISVANLAGTFDPEKETWKSVLIGGWIETKKFLEMTRTAPEDLEALKIPAVEIGKVDLSGTDGNMRVNMEDVAFFAYSTNDPPKIWGTERVSGDYGVAPSPGRTSVPLSGASRDVVLEADFSVTNWNGGKWAAEVGGNGSISGRSVGMRGGAAGDYGNSAFAGTAAGVVSDAAGR